MKFIQGALVKYRGSVVGNIAGMYDPINYPSICTILATDEAKASGVLPYWLWESSARRLDHLQELCLGKYVYTLYIEDLQLARTKLGNML